MTTIYMFTYFSFYMSTNLYIYKYRIDIFVYNLSIYQAINLSIYRYIYKSAYLPICLSIYIYFLYIYQSIYLSREQQKDAEQVLQHEERLSMHQRLEQLESRMRNSTEAAETSD